MNILIDGDACPVITEAVKVSSEFGFRPVIFSDTAHNIQRADADSVTVDKGADSADFAVSAGASGAGFAGMGAMIYAVIRGRGHIEDLSARQVVIMAAFSLYFGFTSEGVDNAAHVGGLICGFLLAVLLYHPSQRAG